MRTTQDNDSGWLRGDRPWQPPGEASAPTGSSGSLTGRRQPWPRLRLGGYQPAPFSSAAFRATLERAEGALRGAATWKTLLLQEMAEIKFHVDGARLDAAQREIDDLTTDVCRLEEHAGEIAATLADLESRDRATSARIEAAAAALRARKADWLLDAAARYDAAADTLASLFAQERDLHEQELALRREVVREFQRGHALHVDFGRPANLHRSVVIPRIDGSGAHFDGRVPVLGQPPGIRAFRD